MAAVTTRQDEKRLEDDEQVEIWAGPPLSLVRPSNTDTFWLGLVSVVQLPAQDVHPAVREAAEVILSAQSEIRELHQRLAERGPARDELLQRLSEIDDVDAAADELSRFDRTTELIRARIPRAEAAELAAWESFSAALYVAGPEWAAYRQRRAGERVQAALEIAEQLQRVLIDLQRLDNLATLVGVIHQNGVPAEETFDRSQRHQTVTRLIGGEDKGLEGVYYGLVDLLMQFRSALIPAPSRDSAEEDTSPRRDSDVEVEPPAVQLRRAQAQAPLPGESAYEVRKRFDPDQIDSSQSD